MVLVLWFRSVKIALFVVSDIIKGERSSAKNQQQRIRNKGSVARGKEPQRER
jgi:hypothetical protein